VDVGLVCDYVLAVQQHTDNGRVSATQRTLTRIPAQQQEQQQQQQQQQHTTVTQNNAAAQHSQRVQLSSVAVVVVVLLLLLLLRGSVPTMPCSQLVHSSSSQA
jgi:hypothetical protein